MRLDCGGGGGGVASTARVLRGELSGWWRARLFIIRQRHTSMHVRSSAVHRFGLAATAWLYLSASTPWV